MSNYQISYLKKKYGNYNEIKNSKIIQHQNNNFIPYTVTIELSLNSKLLSVPIAVNWNSIFFL